MTKPKKFEICFNISLRVCRILEAESYEGAAERAESMAEMGADDLLAKCDPYNEEIEVEVIEVRDEN